jgi:hypothetical protein
VPVGTCRAYLGDLIRRGDRILEAETILHASLRNRKILVDENPTLPEYLRGLATTLNNLGILLEDKGQTADAKAMYRQSLAFYQRSVAD